MCQHALDRGSRFIIISFAAQQTQKLILSKLHGKFQGCHFQADQSLSRQCEIP